MWPFKPKKSDADLAIEWMPKAIGVAVEKWLEFVDQPFTQSMQLDEKIYVFTTGLSAGLRQWQAFKKGPDAIFLLIAAKGVERSRTHLRIEIEAALKMPLPQPHEMTDRKQTEALMSKLKDRVTQKWTFFATQLHFNDDVSLSERIEGFKTPFLKGIRTDHSFLLEAPDEFFDPIIALGIADSGLHTLPEVQQALSIRL